MDLHQLHTFIALFAHFLTGLGGVAVAEIEAQEKLEGYTHRKQL